MASCADSDNSWVLAGSENLPVETLGPEPRMDPESEGASQIPWDPSKAGDKELTGTLDGEEMLFQTESSQNESAALPEMTKAKGTLGGNGHGMDPPGDTVVQEDLQETPMVTSLGPDTQDLENESQPQNLSSSPKAVWKEFHCSSSGDDTDVDVEGLRRRRGREPIPSQPVIPVDVEDQAKGEGRGGELGIPLNMCLLGALVLLGLGILLFSGALLEPETGPLEEAELQVLSDTGPGAELADTMGNRQDEIEQVQASVLPGSIPSLQSMGLLLDKLAKENQDIRLLQAQLQAQKEELQSLLHQPKGLEEENARLRKALQQGKTSHQALESELQQLRAQLQGLEANCVRGVDGVCLSWGGGPQIDKANNNQGHRGQEPDSSLLEQQRQLEAEAQALRQELQRHGQVLGSMHRDLQRALQDPGQGAPAHADLAELGHVLAQTLQGLENWGHNTGIASNNSEAWHQKSHFQNSREWNGKEKRHSGHRDQKAEYWKYRKEEAGRERKKNWRDEGRESAGGWKEDKPRGEYENRKDGKRQDPKAHPRKSGSPRSGERQKHSWGEGNSPEALSSWEELLRRKYRPPQGCSGVADCARQEGLALFGVELAPVRQQELASVLRTYLAQLSWAGQLTKELPLSPAYFGEDGIFRHDRLRFRDFVDALEDSLEEVALKQTGDDDEVDDFEDFVFSHFFGDKALKKRSRKKEKHSGNPRVVGPREEHNRHPHHYHRG
nr:pre-B-cell leukemia transcription factor-interacting protein 1 isoform X1 [Meriones unguiculatus]